MVRKNVKGAKQFNSEIAESLVDEFREFCKSRGESVRDHLEMAIRRHIDNPPPPFKPAAPPLPPVPSPTPAKRKGKK
jgi:hypothetical protein